MNDTMNNTMNIYEKVQKIQQEIGKIEKNKENPYFKSKYFDINELLETLYPLLKEYNLALIQPLTFGSRDGKPSIQTTVIDLDTNRSDEDSGPKPDVISYQTPIVYKSEDPQKMGSAITYYRRYALKSMFGLMAEDDDANKASGPKKKQQTVDDIEKDIAKDKTKDQTEDQK